MEDIKEILKEVKNRGYNLIETVQNEFSVFRIKDDNSLIFIKASVDGFSHQNNENSIVGTGLSTIVVPSKKIINTPKIEPHEDLEVEEIIRGSYIIKNDIMNLQIIPVITQVKRSASKSKNGNPIYQISAGIKQINLGLNTGTQLPKSDEVSPGVQ